MKRIILKIGLAVATVYFVQSPQSTLVGAYCPQEFRPCTTTTTTNGFCGFRRGQDCLACYGDDGSVMETPDCDFYPF